VVEVAPVTLVTEGALQRVPLVLMCRQRDSCMVSPGVPPLLPGDNFNGCNEIAEVIFAKYVQPKELLLNLCQ
jgi:hypothetical protein